MKTILFDLDGTLADIAHRRHYVMSEKKNWVQFNAHIGEDNPNLPIVSFYKKLWQSQQYEIIIVSGRSEQYRKITEQWLIWHEIPFKRLVMRQIKDNRKDAIIKKEILDLLRQEGKDILFAVDDRQQVVDMWRENGITCLQCDKGDF